MEENEKTTEQALSDLVSAFDFLLEKLSKWDTWPQRSYYPKMWSAYDNACEILGKHNWYKDMEGE